MVREFKIVCRVLLILVMISSCVENDSDKEIEKRVKEFYNRYTLLLDNGISSKMVLTLKDGDVKGVISRPDESDREEFMEYYTRGMLCEDSKTEDELIECIIGILKEDGCVRLATCKDCLYPCN
ncbi:hypothetical protein QA597_01945 [Marinilabiliaceae bacterium ANBcel2]|nr:hypothetical protein [Marinilabiliaceae bacterium ANBcel2]